jgi:hypothetical protein
MKKFFSKTSLTRKRVVKLIIYKISNFASYDMYTLVAYALMNYEAVSYI